MCFSMCLFLPPAEFSVLYAIILHLLAIVVLPNVSVSCRGGFDPEHSLPVTICEKSRRLPSGHSPGQLQPGLDSPSAHDYLCSLFIPDLSASLACCIVGGQTRSRCNDCFAFFLLASLPTGVCWICFLFALL